MKPLRHLPIGVAAVLGTLLSIGVFLLSAWWQRQVATLDFQGRAKDHLSVINTDLKDAGKVLETLRAYLESTEREVSRAEFARFSDVLRARTAGLRDTVRFRRRPRRETHPLALGLLLTALAVAWLVVSQRRAPRLPRRGIEMV